jgi:predicted ester cyclase
MEGRMSTERNKEMIRQLAQAHVRSDAARAAEILSPQLSWRLSGQPEPMGRDAYLEGIRMGARAFGEITHTEQALIAEGDKVVALSNWRMRHIGEFAGLAPTQRVIAFSSLWMYRFAEGHVAEIWAFDEDFSAKLK